MKNLTRIALTPARRDALTLIALTLAAAALCARLDISELLLRWTQPHERYQLDELPIVLLILALALIWFSNQRRREARRELMARREAEERLAVTLTENRRLTRLYLEAQEAERKAIARDLHDELGQYLSALRLDAVTIRNRASGQDLPLQNHTAAMLANIERMHAAVIGLIRQLRPVGLDELGLAAALEHCVNEWRRRLPQTAIELSAGAVLERLDESHRLAFYRLVQEAMTNIARHANARHVSIHIGEEVAAAGRASRLIVEVNDDGVGADLTRQNGGLGLIGMRERAQALGGEVSLRSNPRAGFSVRAQIPLGATP
jgi:two-component system sensor histidine kinase UhpB